MDRVGAYEAKTQSSKLLGACYEGRAHYYHQTWGSRRYPSSPPIPENPGIQNTSSPKSGNSGKRQLLRHFLKALIEEGRR